ncbi:MAG: TonB-dependent receptor [Acidobacteria bacterium]|nr:TonB-dependent receptor [Acidobacteriota bacterium]
MKARPLSGRFAMLPMALLATTLFAQSDTTSVNGVVRDPSGSAVPNAKIILRNEATGALREATSTQTGNYVVPSIGSGFYTITVEAPGFKKFESSKNKVDANLPATVDVALQIGQTSEVVEVTASVGAIQTATAQLGRLVEGKQLSDLQLNGRNPIFLALLKPGVRGGSLAGFSFGLSTGGFSINGSRSQDNLITFDGAVGIRTRANGESIGTADLDAVQEVQVLTANYGAEYGRSAGGQIRIVTKTGGQQFHGAVYEYVRNNVLDANSWTNNRNNTVRQPNKFNQFGWNFNGPVYIPGKWNTNKSKLFFYGGMEWVKRRSASSGFRTVPTDRMKGGDFSELLSPSIFVNGTRTLRDPQSSAPFANNVIPASRLSPNGVGLMKVYPSANLAVPQGSSNWFGLKGVPTEQRKDTIAFDGYASDKDSIKFRLSLFHFVDINPFQSGFLISDRTIDRPNQTASLNWTRTITPTLVNETLITASRDQVYLQMTNTPAFDRTTYGINYPYIFPTGKDLPNKLPAVDINNFSGYTGSPYPSSSKGPIYVLSNNTTKITGNHTIKFGVLWERAGQNDYDQINIQGVPGGSDNQNGRFEFRDARTGGSGTAIADVALGLANNYAEIGTRSYTPYRGHMFETFIQDGWKATQNLKVELGLRTTTIQPYYSLWRNMAIFDPSLYDASKAIQVNRATGNPIPGTGDAYNGIVIPGNGWPSAAKGRVPIADSGEFDRLIRGISKSYSNTNTLWQPRAGLAYTIGSKTVLRSGVGRFSTRPGVSDSTFLGGNPPLQPLASIPTPLVDNPGGGSRASFPLSVTSQDKIYKILESWAWNVTVEREIGFRTNLEVSYVGRKGLHLLRERNINQLPAGTLTNAANTGVNANFLRPFAGYGPIRVSNAEASSYYKGFQVGLNRRFARGLSYGLAYTLSKSIDNGSGPRDILPDAFDGSFVWGPSNFDTRHVAVVNFIYELPLLKTNKLLGGWQISGVTQFQTGTPFTVATGDDFAGVGPGSGAQFWRKNGDITYSRQFANFNGEAAYWFNVNPDAQGRQQLYARPAAGTFVREKLRNIIYNPGFQNWNISLFKNFRVTERVNVQFRADGFNYPNHPNWSGADGGPNSATFGKVTGKGSERNLQFGLRLGF